MARGGARPGAGRPARKSTNTSTVSARARPRASRLGKSKAVAGRQGRALGDRPADPVCEKRTDPHGCPDCGHRRKRQGVGLDDASAGGRGWWPDRGPRQDTRRPAARHRRDPGDGRRGLERGARARLRLADNQLAITGSGWDPELLRLELGELQLGGFDLSLTGEAQKRAYVVADSWRLPG